MTEPNANRGPAPFHWRAYRIARPHLRLWAAAALAGLIFLLLPGEATDVVRFLIAFDVAAALWLALAFALVIGADAARVRRRAEAQDEGTWAVFCISLLASIVSVCAVIVEARASAEGADHRLTHMPLVVGTLVLAWLFFHAVFAFHYAREYYRPNPADEAPVLTFPGASEPDYWDFLYFAFNIGTAAQTSDVCVTSARLRRLVLGHQIAAYLFNATVIALSVNVAAALL
ncbi:DUF1345 domain-containing protein [Xanthobacter sp. V4C-4]|uniref:DUF1345 domain-containing protein n=1 Tax=Xanthobacter cornucopiae TaxID=3119924 RepID=UPI003729FF63